MAREAEIVEAKDSENVYICSGRCRLQRKIHLEEGNVRRKVG